MSDLQIPKIKSVLDPDFDGQFDFPAVIDNSMLSNFRMCEGKFYYGMIENLSAQGTSVHLHAGGAFAHGIEHTRRAFYIEGKPAAEAVARGVYELLRYYGDYECPPDSPKSAERMAGALEFYFESYPLGDDYVVPWTDGNGSGIEFSFSFPLPISHPQSGQPILYSGRFDMLGQHREGSLFAVDEKTTSALGPQWSNQWELDSQFTGYIAGARLYNKPVAGAIIRGVSILKTKYDTKEVPIYRPQWMIDRWFKQTVRDVRRAVEIWRLGRDEVNWKLDKSACAAYGKCTFASLCASNDPDRWKPINFEPRVWHPMLREEREAELQRGQLQHTHQPEAQTSSDWNFYSGEV